MTNEATSNEAAERLRNSRFLTTFQKRDLDDALAAERRATVERIRAEAVEYHRFDNEVAWVLLDDLFAILDAEAERQ
jgi:hypothetical protein